MTESRNHGITDRLKTVYPPKTSFCGGYKDLPYEERLRMLNLPTLLYRTQRFDLIQIFKIINGFDNIDTDKFFTFNDNNTRGHLFQLEKHHGRKSLRLNSFPTKCINKWNNLPEEIVCKTSIDSFKIVLDKLWHHKRFDTSTIYWTYTPGTG